MNSKPEKNWQSAYVELSVEQYTSQTHAIELCLNFDKMTLLTMPTQS